MDELVERFFRDFTDTVAREAALLRQPTGNGLLA
jgi:hypothetical protein